RTNIVSIREIFNGLFNISVFVIGFMVFLPDSSDFEDGMMNQAGYAPLALTMAIIGCVGALIATFGTRHKIPDLTRHKDDEPAPWHAMFTELRRAAKLKSFRVVTWSYSSMAVLYGISGALSFYYGVYLWQFSQDAKALFAMVPVLILLPATLSASVLAAKLDKREAAMIFAVTFFLGSILPYAAYLLGAIPPIGDPSLFLILALCHAVGSIGITGIIILCYSMLADVADEMELLTSKRQEGILYSALSFVQKLTFTIGTGFASFALYVISFPKQMKPSQIPQETISHLAMVGFGTALVFGVLTLICFWGYPLTRSKVAEIQSKLKTPKGA
ncbi:MAG: MFS transporter, partial [Maricaulaceae bacterium]